MILYSVLDNNYFSDTSKKQNDDVCVDFEVDGRDVSF